MQFMIIAVVLTGIVWNNKTGVDLYTFVTRHAQLTSSLISSNSLFRVVESSSNDLDNSVDDEDRLLFNQHPSPFLSMPNAFFDLYYRYSNSKSFIECSNSTKYLLESDTAKTTTSSWLLSKENRAELTLFRNYFQHCLTSLSNVNLPIEPYNYRRHFIEYAMRSGLFMRDFRGIGLIPYCAGIRLDAEHVLTAGHCFFNKDVWNFQRALPNRLAESDAEIGIPLSIPAGTKFLEYRNPMRLLEVVGFETPKSDALYYRYDPNKLHEDYAVVQVLSANKENIAPLTLDLPQQWDKIMVLSFLPNKDIVDSISGKSNSRLTPMTNNLNILPSLYVDDSPSCYIFAISKSCIFHNCQTLAGMSGSPIISVDRNRGIRVVGVHTGAVENREFACGFTRGKWIMNYGVVPSINLR